MNKKPYQTSPVSTKGMPKGIPYIIGNEAAERFSFYGMKAILTVFMFRYLWLMNDSPGIQMSRAQATENQHLFTFAVYFTPIAGAFIADFFWGKYRTIIWLSIVYCLGHAALALMGTFGDANRWLLSGLLLICVGAGGIKSCVSAHVGDQFSSSNNHLIPRIFNWFYWSINLGAFASSLMIPWVLEWYGPHLAFGIPGVLMALATMFFFMGRRKFVHIPAGGMSFLKEVFSVEGIKAIGKLLCIYVFVAIFWALFDQTASSWIIQVDDMDRNWLGIEWLPSQIQALNPILILTFIPLFTYFLYPAIDRVFSLTPLRKISIGLFIMVAAWLVVSFAQERIDAGQRPSFGWQVLAYALLTASEVMVSIVCLEFSYTQAPKKMKSFIMSLFLLSVAAGNLFTAGVNHFIQLPDELKAADKIAAKEKIQQVIRPGFDGKKGTSDDIVVNYDKEFHRTKVHYAAKEVVTLAAEKIAEWTEAHVNEVPSLEKGRELIAAIPGTKDIHYQVISSRRCRIFSYGGDAKPLTRYDTGVNLEFSAPEKEAEEGGFWNSLHPKESWLDRRKRELGASESNFENDDNHFVGGQSTLEGAAYFWFFTWLMLGTSVAFVFVAIIYKPKEYLHTKEEDIAMAFDDSH